MFNTNISHVVKDLCASDQLYLIPKGTPLVPFHTAAENPLNILPSISIKYLEDIYLQMLVGKGPSLYYAKYDWYYTVQFLLMANDRDALPITYVSISRLGNPLEANGFLVNLKDRGLYSTTSNIRYY